MMIAWAYLDKKSAAVDALKDYASMKYIIQNHHCELEEAMERMTSLHSSLPDGQPRLALNHQALTQKCASSKKPQVENEKFAMRTYLNRIGLIGDEFKNCREHLCKHLDGNAAWRFRVA